MDCVFPLMPRRLRPDSSHQYYCGTTGIGSGHEQTHAALSHRSEGSDVADAFRLTFAGTAGLVTRGGMSRRWQQPIDYPSSAWIV